MTVKNTFSQTETKSDKEDLRELRDDEIDVSAAGNRVTYYRYELKNVIVSSY